MITPSFALTATERVLPKLALDFTTASLDSRITFTRTTGASNPATYFNSSGVLTAATNNQPRFDYNPVTLVCKGLLIEEARTNMLLYSEQFDDPTWIKTNSTVSANAVISPDGTTTADKLITVNGLTSGRVTQSVTLASTSYSFSVYAKAGEVSLLRLYVSTTSLANFELSTQVITLTGGTSATIEDVGNGWYRCVVVFTATAGATNLRIYNRTSAEQGDGTSGIYIWGAQLEAGAFATSYIPTTTTALTRNADVATMTGTNFSDWFNASEGTFEITYIPYSTAASPSQRVIYADDGTTSNRIYFTSTSTTQLAVTSGGVSQAIVSAGTITANQQNSIAGYYKANAFNVAANTTLGAKDTSGSVPVGVNNLRFFKDAGTTNSLFGHIQKMNYWNIAVTDAEISAFSK